MTGPTIGAGEILVDIFTGNNLVYLALLHGGGVAAFTRDVPNDPAFCGFAVFNQGLCIGGPAVLSNAIDIVVAAL